MASTRKRQRSSSPPSTTASLSAAPRANEEWEKLENGSVLMLPPTIPIICDTLHTPNQDGAAFVVKVAAFDMDDTVIKPASGGVFPKDDPSDWEWVHADVRQHLQHLHRCGFLIVLFSNQMGIGKGSKWNAAKANAIQAKIVLLSRDAAVPLCACVATRDDMWRKPSPHLWKLMEGRIAQCVREGAADAASSAPVAVDCEAYSFYVGDAAGRSAPTLAGRKKDFSCSDRQFAYNLQLPFLTPEQIFCQTIDHLLQDDAMTKRSARVGAEERPSFRLSTALLRQTATSSPAAAAASSTPGFSWGDVSPEELHNLPCTYANLAVQVITPAATKTVPVPSAPPFFARSGQSGQEMILLVGYPGCGKSSFFRRHLQPHGYLHVNRDALQTRAKCIRAAEEYWAAGHSVVIDNTNPTAEDRQAYIDIVKKHMKAKKGSGGAALPVRIFYFTHTRGMAQHMNLVRAYVERVPRVPAIAYNVFHARLQRPTTPEQVAALGIDSVWEIPSVACFDGAPSGTEQAFNLLL